MLAKRMIRTGIAFAVSAAMLVSGSTLSVSYAAASGTGYEFDHAKTAVEQLEELFTTIDIMDATVAGLTDEMEQGNVTSEQLVQMYIDRINAYDKKKKLNSIISINPGALDEARQLDAERQAGKVRGALHGIPVLVKDNYDVKGTATTAGSLALTNWASEKDSFAVQKLKEAGAVVVAKANLSEFAYSAINSHSLIGGYVHNPYDVTRSPAGSSGGTGVAVAANFATIGLGTDTGGSIRNPSSWCNLYGIRPSKGLTSIDGVVPLAAFRDTAGPMTRTAEDMALALQTIAGTDPNDDYTQEADADALVADGYTQYLSKDSLKGKRVGYLASSFSYTMPEEPEGGGEPKETLHNMDKKVSQLVRRTRADLRKAGATFVDMSDVITDEEVMDMDMAYGYYEDIPSMEYDINRYLYGHGDNAPYRTVKELLVSGKKAIDYENLEIDPATCADSYEETVNPYTEDINGYKRLKVWEKILSDRAKLAEAMEQKNVDAIMFVQDLNVPVHDAEDLKDMMPQLSGSVNIVANYYAMVLSASMGYPDMVLPMGFSETDENCPVPMPVGMHFLGRFGGERALMEIAYAYEQQAGPDIRQAPESTPALKDKNLNAYLRALMNEVYSIDYASFGSRPEGKAKLMEKAYDKAAAVDTSDPYAVYDAAYDLAEAYDNTVASLKKGKTSFKVTPSKKKIRVASLKKKGCTVTMKVTGLTKGSSKPAFTIKKVTNGQKARVKVNSRTGKVTVMKKTKKCTIYVKAASKETKTRKAASRTIKLVVR